MTRRQQDTGVQERTQERATVRRPRMHRVVLLNDDYTPMDFVVMILQRYFRKSEAEAHRVMLAVHQRGYGVAGVYTREVAETKAAQVVAHARQEGHPLQVTTEPEGTGDDE